MKRDNFCVRHGKVKLLGLSPHFFLLLCKIYISASNKGKKWKERKLTVKEVTKLAEKNYLNLFALYLVV